MSSPVPLCRRCWRTEDDGPHWSSAGLTVDPRDWAERLHDFVPGRQQQVPPRRRAAAAVE